MEKWYKQSRISLPERSNVLLLCWLGQVRGDRAAPVTEHLCELRRSGESGWRHVLMWQTAGHWVKLARKNDCAEFKKNLKGCLTWLTSSRTPVKQSVCNDFYLLSVNLYIFCDIKLWRSPALSLPDFEPSWLAEASTENLRAFWPSDSVRSWIWTVIYSKCAAKIW